MQTGLWLTAFLMGAASGPHCVAMCAAACGALCAPQAHRDEPGYKAPAQVRQGPKPIFLLRALPAGAASAATIATPTRAAWGRSLVFHAGRVAGYASAGAASAFAMQGLANASEALAMLRPLWLMLHVFIGVWGIAMLVLGRQPVWLSRGSAALLARARSGAMARTRLFAGGAAWAGMPCGLLYSALLLAALGNDAATGAGVMALFALGSLPWLLAAPWLWRQLKARLDGARREWGTRLAGGVLLVVAAQAISLDLQHRIAAWCSALGL